MKPGTTSRPAKIVHLEDNVLDQELVAAMLRRAGIQCDLICADSNESFITALEHVPADLIISDFSLPGYGGSQALETARGLRERVPFIFFSGTLGEEAAVESLRNGATDYVLKQRPERLVAAVRRALEDAAEREARARMEEKLHQRDMLLRQILENVDDFVEVVDLNGRVALSSPSLGRLFGTAASTVGDDFLKHTHPEDRPRALAAFLQTAEEGVSSRVEYRLVLPGGAVRVIEAQSSLMRDEGGGTPSVLWVARDVTERRLAEEQIQEQAALLDKARDAICVTDLDQRLLYWNRSAEELYGWTAREVLGRNANEVLGQGEVALSALKTLIQRGEWHGQLDQTTRSGKRLAIESRWTLIRSGEMPKSIFIINTDITEQKKLEAQFLRTQRMESIGALAGGIAHDLNNVLGPIMMAVEVVQMDPDSESRASMLDLVGASARRGADLVKQILSFARGVDGEKVSLEIRDLVAEVVKLARDTFPRAISVQSAIPGDLPRIHGDSTQLHQVLLNLGVNARDAMPEGGALTIEARTVELHNRVTEFQPEPLFGTFIELKVSDTGAGIPPEVLPKIFEPFFTTKEHGKGTGLGLPTVLGIVKGHGGFLEVTSEPNKGTTFIVYLPVLKSAPESRTEIPETAPQLGRNECVLLVDDEAAILEISRTTLAVFNYRVLTANSGSEAIAVFAENLADIDLVVTDMMMPSMGGAELIAVLRKIKPDVKVIAVSGLPPQHASGYPDGIKSFLKKPYSTAKLLSVMRAVLDD